MSYIVIKDPLAHERALSLARGDYQRGLLLGTEAMSGATLKGRARSYGARYAQSRAGLIARLRAAGIPVVEVRGKHGKRQLVIG